MEIVNHNNLPKAVELILRKIDEITDALAEGTPLIVTVNDGDKIYSLKEACTQVGISRSTMHRLITNNDIPYHKTGRQYKFFHKELIGWLESTGRASWPSYNGVVDSMKSNAV